MILLFLTLIPGLLWDEGPKTAPVLAKAGIREIVTTGEASAWDGTNVRATNVKAATLEKLDAPGVDFQATRGGATGDPWINSNLWRELKDHGKAFVYDVSGPAVPLAVAEAYASGARTYIRVKQDDLVAFAAAIRFLREIDAPLLESRVNFGLVDDGSPEMEEVMNLLVRRNLLFQPLGATTEWKGATVRVGTPEYTKAMEAEPYAFAAVVRDRIGDDRRLVRIYGSNTTVVRMYGSGTHSRLHLIQYGRNPVRGLRVRVLGRYPRVLVAGLGQRLTVPEDVTMDDTATEFTIPEFRTYAVVDLDESSQGLLTSVHSDRNFALTTDPEAEQWKSAPPVSIGTGALGEPLPFGATKVRSRWTSDTLYLLYACPFSALNLKPEPATDRETPVLWNWDVAEAFIGADFKNVGQYREYQVSPQGEWVDLDIDVLNPKPGGGMSWNSAFEVKARIDQANRIWYGEMRIPLQSIAAREWRAGDRARLGLFRCAGPLEQRNLVAWQPPFRRNFHVPEAFGILELKP